MVGMRNFHDTFETRKRSFISAFSICMTVPSTQPKISKQFLILNFGKPHPIEAATKGALQVFLKIGVLKYFAKPTLCQNLFEYSCRPQICTFIEKETLAQVFSCKFCETFKNTFFHRIPLMAASECIQDPVKHL